MAPTQPKVGDANPSFTLTLTAPDLVLETATTAGNSINTLASGVETQLSLDPIKSGELEKRASVMGLGFGGGQDAWKRMTTGIAWPNLEGLPDDGTIDEDELTPEEREDRRVKSRAAAMAKLMGDPESSDSKAEPVSAPVSLPRKLMDVVEEEEED